MLQATLALLAPVRHASGEWWRVGPKSVHKALLKLADDKDDLVGLAAERELVRFDR